MLLADATSHVMDKTLLEVGGVPVLTTNMVTLVAATLLILWILLKAAKAIQTGPPSEGRERYVTRGPLAQLVEMIVVYLRDQMIEPVMGKRLTSRFLPYLLTVFFFVLMNNMLGLLPLFDVQKIIGIDEAHPWIGGTATANLAVTAALAFVSFLVIQINAVMDLGVRGWVHHLLGGAPWWLFPIMVPVELAGHIIKPAALAIRLFANMVAGHTLLATLLFFGYSAYKSGMGAFGIGSITLVASLGALAVWFLEFFVAVLQAFIFMFLTAVFITLLSHHDEHAHEHEHDQGHGHQPETAHA